MTMGFTTSLFSGFTLTSTVLYLSLLYHQQARAHQTELLRQQHLLLNSITDPVIASNLATAADANYSGGLREGIRDYRIEKAPWVERWKDGWNREITSAARWAQSVRWSQVRDGLELRARDWNEGERRA